MRFRPRDLSAEVEVRQRLVHGLHPELLAGLHRRVDLVDLLLADHVPDRRGRNQDLHGESAAAAVTPRDEELVEDGLEHERQLGPHLGLLVRREDVDDPVDRLRARVRVQRREGEVPRLRDRQRRLDRLQVPHLPDEHDVRVLPKDVLQGGREGVRVAPDLALVHERLLVLVQVLEGVLDGDDVNVTLPVDAVEHGRHRGRLPVSGRPGHQDEPLVLLDQLGADLGREPELLEALGLMGDGADRHARRCPAAGRR